MDKQGTRRKLNTLILFLGFTLYAGFNLLLLIRHQPYRDEANVWLMAKHLSPVSLLREIHYQGHPCLWYFLVMPLAKAGLPYKAMELLSFSIMLVTAAVFLWKANTDTAVKLFCLASPFFTYFYPVIARNYCLIALLMMACAWFYPKRNEKPYAYGLLLGLLVQADTIAIAVSGALSAAWLFEAAATAVKQKRKDALVTAAKGLWMPFVSLLFWLFQMRGVSDCQAYQVRWQGLAALLQDIGDYSLRIIARLTGWNTPTITVFLAVFLGACIWTACVAGDVTPLFVMLVSYLFQAVFSAVVYELHIWHFLSLGFVMLWMLWMLRDSMEKNCPASRSGKGAVRVAELAVVALSFCMALHWNSGQETSNLERALHVPYSDGYKAACFMREHVDQNALIFTTDVAMTSSVLAYLDGYVFLYAGSGIPVTYATWSEEQLRTISFDGLDDWVGRNYPEIGEYYVIQTAASCLEDGETLKRFRQVYKTAQDTTKGENYTIYCIQRES